MQEILKISLKAARVNAGLTLIDASKAIGIGKDTLIKWESDPAIVNTKRQIRISEAYNIPIDCINFGK